MSFGLDRKANKLARPTESRLRPTHGMGGHEIYGMAAREGFLPAMRGCLIDESQRDTLYAKSSSTLNFKADVPDLFPLTSRRVGLGKSLPQPNTYV